MAYALPARSARYLASTRPSSVCRVHTCLRCQSSVDSYEPCSFVPNVVQVCPSCAAQEHALAHLAMSRRVWGAGLARTPRR